MASKNETEPSLLTIPANHRLLETATLMAVMTPKKLLLSAKDSDVLLKAFHKLQAHQLLALPIYSPEKQRFFGFLDVADLVSFILKITTKFDKAGQTTLSGFLETEETFNSSTCGTVANMSHHNPYTQVAPEANLSTAIVLLTTFSNLHRFAVVGPYPKYELLGVVSQSDILRWLNAYLERPEPILSKTLKELNVGTKHVKTVKTTDTVQTALETMKKFNVSAVAVLDAKTGKLAGNFSMSELRTLCSIDVDSLIAFTQKTCGEVVEEAKEKWPSKTYPVTLKSDTTLQQCMDLIMGAKVHRAYLVDNENNLLGVVAISDILKLFGPQPSSSPY